MQGAIRHGNLGDSKDRKEKQGHEYCSNLNSEKGHFAVSDSLAGEGMRRNWGMALMHHFDWSFLAEMGTVLEVLLSWLYYPQLNNELPCGIQLRQQKVGRSLALLRCEKVL
jgi:hypothetical protein